MEQRLIVSDLHLDAWSTRNPKHRNKQPMILARKLVKIGQELGITKLSILGDFLNRSTNRPRVLKYAYLVLEELQKQFFVELIFGQHDFDDKREDITENDCALIYNDFNGRVKYVNNTTLVEEGCTLFFSDYQFSEEVKCPDGVDVFLSHVTIGPFGQTIKGSFKLGIFGDIHTPMDFIDEFGRELHSVGSPYQISISEPSESIGLLTLDNGKATFERIPSSDSKHQYVRMYYDYEAPSNLRKIDVVVASSEDSFELDSPELQGIKINKISELRDKSFINEVVKKNFDDDLQKIHSKVSRKIKTTEPVDLKASIEELELWNFGSVEHIKLDFKTKKEIFFIYGTNGSGKSQIINGLKVGLLGDRKLQSWGRKGYESEVCTSVTLSYQGSKYNILRGVGYTSFFEYANEEWVEITRKSKTELEAHIYERLPFLNMLGYFILHPRSTFWGDMDRTQFFSDCFGLEILDNYKNEAYEQLVAVSQKLNSETDKVKFLQSRVEGIKKQVSQIDEQIQVEFSDLINVDQFDYAEKLQTINSSISLIHELNGKKSVLESQIIEIGNLPPEEWFTKQIEIENEISSKLESYNKVKSELEASMSLLSKKLNSNTVICSKCSTLNSVLGGDISSLKAEYEDLKQKKESLVPPDPHSYSVTNLTRDLEKRKQKSQLETSLKEVISRLEGLPKLEDLNLERNSLQKQISRLQSYNVLIGMRTTQINGLEDTEKEIPIHLEKVEILTKDKVQLEKYLSMFDLKNENSLYRKVLDYITACINSDTIKFTTTDTLKNGNVVFNLNCSLNVQGEWIEYEKISDGQLTKVDIGIIAGFIKALGGVGLVILDETLAYVSPDNYEFIESVIRDISSNLIIITSQSRQLTCYDRKINIKLENRVTKLI